MDQQFSGQADVILELKTQGGASDTWPEASGVTSARRRIQYRLYADIEIARGQVILRPTERSRRHLVAHREPSPPPIQNHWRTNIHSQANFDWHGGTPAESVDLDDYPDGVFDLPEVEYLPIADMIVTTEHLIDRDLDVPVNPGGTNFVNGTTWFLEGEHERETETHDTIGR